MEPELLSSFRMREELTVHDECLLQGVRVVVRGKLRRKGLEKLHEGHVGALKIKGLTRRWPGIDSEAENNSKSCSSCQLT